MGMYFQDDYWEAAKLLPTNERRAFLEAVLAYYFDGEEPQLKGVTMAVFVAIRERLDLSKKRSEAGSKCTSNENQNDIKQESKSHQTQIKTESKAHHSTIERERERDIPPYTLSGICPPSEEPKNKTAFKPPTVSEVEEYCRTNDKPIDAEAFWNFYEAKGWMIGKNKMRNWHCAVANWYKGDEKDGRHARPDFSSYD